MKRILSIAASDSGGGAGIQADIKTITALGGYAMTAVTALTVQDTCGVKAVHPVPADVVQAQIETVLRDMGADAVKIGMLYSADTVRAVAAALKKHPVPFVIVDPVMKSSSGEDLLESPALDALKTELLPQAFLVTPNLEETSCLAGIKVDSLDKMKAAAISIRQTGPRYVLITGGHLQGDCIDLLFNGETCQEFSGPRIATQHTHGTGCTLSTAIATELALGATPAEAVRAAKQFVTTAIRFARPLGKGHGPVNQVAALPREAHLSLSIKRLQSAFTRLQSARIGHIIPEIQSNLGYALADAAAPEDIVAFPGRIIRLGQSIARVADPAPGASQHIAKILLTVIRFDPRYRAAMNIAWSPELIETCSALGLSIGEFSRSDEPADVKEREGSTLEWGTGKVLEESSGIPDIIFDRGDVGKEPIIRVLGYDPEDVTDKVINIAKEIDKQC